MGFFDFFKGGVEKHARRVANKHTQAAERWEAIQALREAKTPEAVSALLVRFTFRCDPGITDQEEKEAVVQALVEIGNDADSTLRRETVDIIKQALGNQDSIAGPMKCINALLERDESTGVLLDILASMHTDYERDPAKKTDVIAALQDRDDPRVLDGVTRFLEDMHETVRFHAISTLFAQSGVQDIKADLVKHFLEEESVRVRALILDQFIAHEWKLESGLGQVQQVQQVQPLLPQGYSISRDGSLARRS